MNTTMKRLYDYHLARTGSRHRAWTATQTIWAYLTAVTQFDSRDMPVSPWTATRRRNDLRAAGLAPITSSDALVELARDLGVSDTTSLIRLVRTLNAVETRSNTSATTRYFELITQTFAALSAPTDQDNTASVA